jgi:hypothetical protein
VELQGTAISCSIVDKKFTTISWTRLARKYVQQFLGMERVQEIKRGGTVQEMETKLLPGEFLCSNDSQEIVKKKAFLQEITQKWC